MSTNKITATCEVIEHSTGTVLSKRIIGQYDDVDTASFAAFRERRDDETVFLYGVPCQDMETHNLSAYEIAEDEVEWDLLAGDL